MQTLKFGTSIADTLRVYAEEFRDKRMQRAEEKAAKIGTKLIFPLVFCLFPAFFVVAIGPAVIRFVEVFRILGDRTGVSVPRELQCRLAPVLASGWVLAFAPLLAALLAGCASQPTRRGGAAGIQKATEEMANQLYAGEPKIVHSTEYPVTSAADGIQRGDEAYARASSTSRSTCTCSRCRSIRPVPRRS